MSNSVAKYIKGHTRMLELSFLKGLPLPKRSLLVVFVTALSLPYL